MQYTIEARQLSGDDSPQKPSLDAEPRRLIVEASDAGEAIWRFVRNEESELVSFQAVRGRESIATVKKNDSVYLVRVYAG